MDAFLTHTAGGHGNRRPKDGGDEVPRTCEKSPRTWYGGAIGKLDSTAASIRNNAANYTIKGGHAEVGSALPCYGIPTLSQKKKSKLEPPLSSMRSDFPVNVKRLFLPYHGEGKNPLGRPHGLVRAHTR